MKVYAVIDTNVIVSAFLSRNPDSATVGVLNAVLKGRIIPMYNEDILLEYKEVLAREKFNIPQHLLNAVMSEISHLGIPSERVSGHSDFVNPDDIVFYEVAMSRNDSYLITGNLKHFPENIRIVSPSEMIAILETAD